MNGNVAAMPEELTKELATFEDRREELLRTAAGRYVLIHEAEVVGAYETERDAIDEGYRRFGNVPFLVRQVSPSERPLNFLSHLVRL